MTYTVSGGALNSTQTKPNQSRPAAESRHGGLYLYVLLLFFLFTYFNDFYKTNYLKKIYRTDLRQFLELVKLWL